MLVAVSVVLGLVTVVMAAVAAAGWTVALPALLLLRSAFVAVFTPAERAALPRVVERDELLLAGSIDAGSWSVMFCFGMALGGVISLLGIGTALAIDAATFFASAAAFWGLPAMEPRASETPVSAEARSAWRRELADGLGALGHAWRRPALARAVFAKTPLALASGTAWLALALRAQDLGGMAAAGVAFGLLHAARGIGTGVGPVLLSAVKLRGGDPLRWWAGSYALGLGGMVAFAWAPGWPALVLGALGWGIGLGANWVLSTEQLQSRAPDAILARLSAVDHLAFIVAQTLGVTLAAVTATTGVGDAPAVLLAAITAFTGFSWLSGRMPARARARVTAP